MTLQKPLLGIFLVMGGYILALVLVEPRNHEVSRFTELWPALFAVAAASLFSYAIRYFRWRWLFSRVGVQIKPWSGFLSYLAGFAFTVTPGKVGELVRIRYLNKMGVSPRLTLAAFIYERTFDLLTVFALASFLFDRKIIILFVLVFVICTVFGFALLATKTFFFNKVIKYLLRSRAKRFARLIVSLRNGIDGCKIWVTPLDLAACFLLGVLGWGITALSFVYFCRYLGIWIPFREHFSIYPVSILAGAVSMIPGGLASTEGSIVALLSSMGAEFDVSVLAAVGIRLSTLWFSLLLGFSSVLYLETRKSAIALFSSK